MTTATTNYGWVKPDVGSSDDVWGDLLNADLDGIDSTVKSVSSAIPLASSTTPAMNGAAAIGSATTWAKADHVHPTDTTLLPKSGGTLTGALTPAAAGIVGTATNNNAPAGAIGEYIRGDRLQGAATGIISATPLNVWSVTLTAGDWDVIGGVSFQTSGNNATTLMFSVSPTSGAMTGDAFGQFSLQVTSGAINNFSTSQCGPVRVSIAATTTYYLVARIDFPSGTATIWGSIAARRAR